ncbi:hypothetical protein Bca101_036661 [Brassica carinata]
MRKVIAVDATWLKNRYGGVLVFTKAQDPNGHSYPLAFTVLDGENFASWTWFFEMLKSVIPDSSELVFMSERNQSLVFTIGNVFPQAHHGHCLWHLKEKVKWHACNVNKNIVGLIDTRLVPVVENYLHDLWVVAQQLYVRELNSDELKYEITDTAGKMIWASLVGKSCTCKVWDYEKFPCLHGLAAYIYFTTNVDGSRLNIHELCSKYYWTELWALAYDRTLYVVPDMSSWNVPDQIKEDGGRIHQRWTGDMIGFYTAAEDDGGPSRNEVGVAIEPYGRVPFSQTQSPRTAVVEISPQSDRILMNMRDMKIS